MKILKYIKFIFCVALIFSMMMPSYAALSEADGYELITKAEFDSTLSDFNNKINELEADINSKIDSQVSLYLEKNGIWSGQSVDWEQKSYDITLADIGSGLAAYENSIKKVHRFYAKNKKSGLLYVKYNMRVTHSGVNNFRPYIRFTGAGYDGLESMMTLSLVAGECDRSGATIVEEKEYSQIISDNHQAAGSTNYGNDSALILLFPMNNTWAVTYFVDGKKDVYIGLDVSRINVYGSASGNVNLNVWGNSGRLNVFVDESYVY